MADLDQDISPIPRSREENQERAFIAASRRKDRTLDARLESANRASMLHKKRTGKAFHITKEIVEKEAMYEEVDERYQEKRIRMLQAQNMQIEEQFHRHLLAAFAARANSTGSASSSIASRRTSMAPRGSIDAGSSRKMSLDLSSLQSPFPQGMGSGSMASPMTAGEGYAMSPSSAFDSNTQSSYMTCMDGSGDSFFSHPVTGASATSTLQVPAYATQAPTPAWGPQKAPSWTAMQQHVPTPNQTPTDSQAVHMWQQQMMQQAQMPSDTAASIHMRQFRDRLASAPELPVQQPVAPPQPVASVSGPSGGHGHSRGQSQPSNNFHNLHLLTQGTPVAQAQAQAQMAPSSNSSPKVESSLSAETQSTPDFCPTPNTPLSPTAVGTATSVPAAKDEGDGIMVSHEQLDPDYNEFSQFAMGLGNSSNSLQEHESFGLDDFVILDEFGAVAPC